DRALAVGRQRLDHVLVYGQDDRVAGQVALGGQLDRSAAADDSAAQLDLAFELEQRGCGLGPDGAVLVGGGSGLGQGGSERVGADGAPAAGHVEALGGGEALHIDLAVPDHVVVAGDDIGDAVLESGRAEHAVEERVDRADVVAVVEL